VGEDHGVFQVWLFFFAKLGAMGRPRFALNQGRSGRFRYDQPMRGFLFAGLMLGLLSGVAGAAAPILSPHDDGGMVRQFYLLRHDDLAWSGDAQAKAHARQAFAVLSRAASEGLDAGRYRAFVEGDDKVANDVSLSKAVLTYMHDLSVGRADLRAVDTDVELPKAAQDFPPMLDAALRQDRLEALLESLAPRHEGYAALKAALKTSLAQSDGKADIIAANMERWRWLPASLEPDRIMVNTASADLEMWLGGKLVLTSRVIVGKPSTPTPILRAEGAGLTINPPWNVPHSIAAREILPKLKRNPAWLAKNDMVLLNGPAGDPQGVHIDWRKIPAGSFPYQIRQYPGPRNPLGQIKLELPNRFDVYLHDTPGKADFQKEARHRSHGCVRVEKILPLANYALGGDIAAMQTITQAMEQGDTAYMPLHKKLPVYFLYWTAVPGADGELRFYKDVYDRDKRLIAAMHSQALRIAAWDAPCTKG
jgi:murein L,D-transpeptidase YcbB/YkuD